MADKLTTTLLGSEWEIDAAWGLRAWMQYSVNLKAAKATGTPLRDIVVNRDLTYSPQFYDASNGSPLANGQTEELMLGHLLLTGPMMLEGGACSDGVRQLNQKMRAMASREDVGGLLVEVNSGGGETYAGTEFQNAVNDVQNRLGKPVVIYTQMLASAALRGAAPAVAIIGSNAATTIGSLGTYLTIDLKMLKELKENFKDVYATQSTLKNADFREVAAGDFERIQKYVDVKAQAFIDEMKGYRPIKGTKEQTERLYSGDLFSAEEAYEIGLIDGVGTLMEAFDLLRKLVSKNNGRSTSDVNQKNYQPMGLKDFLTGGIPKEVAQVEPTDATTEIVDDRFKAMEDRINELTDSVVELRTYVGEQATTIAALNDENRKLEAQIVQVKGSMTSGHLPGDKEDAVNANQPDVKRFATVASFEKVTGVTSKY